MQGIQEPGKKVNSITYKEGEGGGNERKGLSEHLTLGSMIKAGSPPPEVEHSRFKISQEGIMHGEVLSPLTDSLGSPLLPFIYLGIQMVNILDLDA